MRTRSLMIIIVLLLAACAPDTALIGDEGPRLVDERSLDATNSVNAVPTLFVLPTVTPLLGSTAVPTEVVQIPIATADQDDAPVITQTSLPSKTPTITPTQTTTPTITTTPTTTVTATATPTNDQFAQPNTPQGGAAAQAPPLPANIGGGGGAAFVGAAADPAQCTATPWFFAVGLYAPPTCPQERPITGHGVFQRFQEGYMIWMEHNDKIYVMYNTAEQPRWQVFDDPYIEGAPELDYAWFTYERQPPQSYQPRRGFGEIWRGREDVRFRIGWAVQQWETIYTPRFQRGDDGSVSIEHPEGGVFYLAPRGTDWALFMDRRR